MGNRSGWYFKARAKYDHTVDIFVQILLLKTVCKFSRVAQ